MAPDDWELLRNYLNGDRAAMELLVRRHVDFVYATARRLVGAADAPDITQAVFLLLTQKAATIRERGSVVGWLYRATRYCASNLKKMEARRRHHQREAAMRNLTPTKPPELPWLEDLDAALERIGEVDRQAVLLHFAERQTFDQAGQALGISAEAARKRTDRALAKLREFLLGRGYTVPAGSSIGAALFAGGLKAPAFITQQALSAALGAKVSYTAATLAQETAKAMLAAKVKAAAITAGLFSGIAASIAALALLWPAHLANPAALPQPGLDDTPYIREVPSTVDISPKTLVRLDTEPTESEARMALRQRMDLLNTMVASYTMHADFPADGHPPTVGDPRRAPFIAGTSADISKVLFVQSGAAQYVWQMRDALSTTQRTAPSEKWIDILTPESAERLLLDGAGRFTLLDHLSPGTGAPRIEPDIETALGLCGQPSRPGAESAPLTEEALASISITFPDRQTATLARTMPDGKETWTLDRTRGYAPLIYRRFTASATPDIEMVMSDFIEVSGGFAGGAGRSSVRGIVELPRSVTRVSRASNTQLIWRVERMAVREYLIADAGRAAGQHLLSLPRDTAPDLAPRDQALGK